MNGDVPDPLLDSVRRRVAETLGCAVVSVEEIDPGTVHNNRLWRLRGADGRELVAKVYYRDARRRLDREFGAISFLRHRGCTSVPVPYLRDGAHGFAVYSYEPGETRPAAALTHKELAALGAFAGHLHRVRRGEPGAVFPEAIGSCFSFAEQVAGIRRRLDTFCAFAGRPEAFDEVRALCALQDVRQDVERLIAAATAGLSDADLAARVPEHAWRLNTSDFAPHNVLIRPPSHPGGPICVLDFEYCGWDDPLALPAGFVTADTSLNLSDVQAQTFLRAYRDGAGEAGDLFAAAQERFQRVCALMHVSWSAVHLGLLTPERIAAKRHAIPSLDVQALLEEQIGKFRRRLVRAEQAVRAL